VLEVLAPRTAAERARIKRARLSRHPLLQGCSARLVRRVATVADMVDVPAGEVLVERDWQGLWFFVVERGRAEAVHGDGRREQLTPGQWFGEAAVLRHVPQPATVVAATDMTLFVISCQRLVPLVRDSRALRRRLGDVVVAPRLPVLPDLSPPARPEWARRVEPLDRRPPARSRRRWRWVAAVAVAAFAAGIAAVYHPPVAVVTAGPVFDAGRDVIITGVPWSRPNGRYLVPTVRTSRPTLLWLGLAVARSHRRLVAVRDSNSAMLRAQGEAVFDRSRLLAAAAAAKAAGLPVQVDGRGAVVLPFVIRFRERPVVGPSAGLAYALAIEDMLDPADVAHGRTLAATGEIRPDGQVGPVGFVSQKAIAARGSGATLLLVPDGEFTDDAGRRLAVRSVTSLREALAALGPSVSVSALR